MEVVGIEDYLPDMDQVPGRVIVTLQEVEEYQTRSGLAVPFRGATYRDLQVSLRWDYL